MRKDAAEVRTREAAPLGASDPECRRAAGGELHRDALGGRFVPHSLQVLELVEEGDESPGVSHVPTRSVAEADEPRAVGRREMRPLSFELREGQRVLDRLERAPIGGRPTADLDVTAE